MKNFKLCVFIVSNALLLLMQKGKRDRCLHHFKRSKVCTKVCFKKIVTHLLVYIVANV